MKLSYVYLDEYREPPQAMVFEGGPRHGKSYSNIWADEVEDYKPLYAWRTWPEREYYLKTARPIRYKRTDRVDEENRVIYEFAGYIK